MTAQAPAQVQVQMQASNDVANPSVATILARLWAIAGLDPAALEDVQLTGAEPVLPSTFRVDAAAQSTIAASALAAAQVLRQRSGVRQQAVVGMRHAAAEFRSERYMRVDGKTVGETWDRIAGAYPCGDGRWVRLHTNFAHHRDGVLKILGCAYDKEAVAKALLGWKAEAFETAASEASLVVAMMRSFAEWDAHPHGKAIAGLPVMTLERIGDTLAMPLAQSDRPLSGVRVLDLTRVIAGPVCGRTLAAHGADVLNITAAHLPAVHPLVIDSGRGKLTAQLDLRTNEGRAKLQALVRECDIFVQGYRPGGLASHGFAPEELVRLRPGIICVTLSAYGHAGPWSGKRGFDSLVQTATGFNHAEGQAAGIDKPGPLPCQALDHGSGYLMAFGALAALSRRAREGGSWQVRVSLAQTGHWLRHLGRLPNGLAVPDTTFDAVKDLLETTKSGHGAQTGVRHAGVLTKTPTRWDRPAMPLGAHPAQWPARK
jgi:crotonobetainyl-CoA:carnitine CoA-transferase CaiB-like acyl-CoA transferase